MRNYIAIKGKDGEALNRILTAAERRGDEHITNEQLRVISKQVPKIYEYNRAIHSALEHLTIGKADQLSIYGVNGGLDAWRRLYHE